MKKIKKKKILELTQLESDDLASLVHLGLQKAKKDHKDSPKFLKAGERLNKKIYKFSCKD